MTIDTRSELLRNVRPGAWVALSDDETKLVATGDTYEEVVAELDRIGDATAFIIKIPQSPVPLTV